MSLTLGEKLRQAREERGFTISEVAEQTRISALYLESIENDDYRILPGGIFNKGFVKSYAKFVGIDEAEALSDYSALISRTTPGEDEHNLKVYRPEVLTDDRTSSSMLPTVILAAVILGLMTAGILFLVSYLRDSDEPSAANANVRTNSNSNVETPPATPVSTGLPTMDTVKVEFSVSEPVSLTATSDGKMSSNIVNPGTPAIFEPRESLKLGYSKSLAKAVQLKINGKDIAVPAQPLMPRRNAIEFEINKDNLSQIWTSGAIAAETPATEPASSVTEAPANTASTPAPVTVPSPAKTPAPRPSPAANTTTNAAPRPTPARPAETPAARPRPTANTEPGQ